MRIRSGWSAALLAVALLALACSTSDSPPVVTATGSQGRVADWYPTPTPFVSAAPTKAPTPLPSNIPPTPTP